VFGVQCSVFSVERGARVRNDDDSLASETLQGSRESFRLLVERYRSRLYTVALGILQNQDQAADAVQEAFLKAYRSLGHYRGGAFGAWLRRILVNECLTVLRARQPYLSLEQLGHEHPADERSPEDQCLARAEAAEIRGAMAQLPAHYRAALVLRVTEDLSYREISRLLEVPVTSVETWIHRARLRLRQTLGSTFSEASWSEHGQVAPPAYNPDDMRSR